MTTRKPDVRLRRARGSLTQAEAADQVGVPLVTYVRWELGYHQPSRFAREALERWLTKRLKGGAR